MKEYNFKWGKVYYIEEGILCVEYFDDVYVEEEDVIEFRAVFGKEAEKRKLKLLVLPGKRTNASREAREYSQRTQLNSLGEAIVVQSLAQRIISNFYISFKNKADYPIKMFNNKDEALNWLKSV